MERLWELKFEANGLTHAPDDPHIWWRYIDDVFMRWTSGNLHAFTTYLNGIHPATIKFKCNRSSTSIPFFTVVHNCHGTYTKSRHNRVNSRHNRHSFNTAEVKCYGESEMPRRNCTCFHDAVHSDPIIS